MKEFLKHGKKKHLIILFLLGLICMIGSNLFTKEEKKASQVEKTIQTTDYQRKYEADLANILEEMEGVAHVQVIITLATKERTVYEKNNKTEKGETIETDKQGGKREVVETRVEEQVVVVGDNPVVRQVETPEISGVLVVAKGVGNLDVKENVIEAVTRVMSVERHQVSVQERG